MTSNIFNIICYISPPKPKYEFLNSCTWMWSLSDCVVRGRKTCLQSPVLDVSEVQIKVCRISPSSKTLSSELFLLGLWYQNSRQESSETLINPLLRRNAPDGLSGWRDVSSKARRQNTCQFKWFGRELLKWCPSYQFWFSVKIFAF